MDDQALSPELLAQQYPGLCRLIKRRIKDAAVAEELLNDAIITAIAHLRAGRIARPDQIGGYVYRVAMNLYRNHCREFNNRTDLKGGDESINELVSTERAPEDAPDQKLAARVKAIVAALPTPRDREIVKRFYLDEEDKESICKSLALSPLQFDKICFRARKRMQALLEIEGFTKQDLLSILVLC